jgi:hypothetical protein
MSNQQNNPYTNWNSNFSNDSPYQNQIQSSSYQNFSFQTHSSQSSITKLFEKDSSIPVVSVVVTICDGSTYDSLFSSVEQKPPQGRVAVYSVPTEKLETLLKDMKAGESDDKIIQELIVDMKSVTPDCIVFNWECCSGCGNSTFKNSAVTFELIKHLLDSGSMVMLGDFSMKALINQWDVDSLGPCPFVKLGECSDKIELNFNPSKLTSCPSKQLEMVGKLCETGKCVIHALSGTIVFGYNPKNSDTDVYDLEILTVATNKNNHKENLFQIEGTKVEGTVGHAMLKYKSGGIMMVSAGHWIELTHLDVNEDSMEKVSKEYGELYDTEFQNIKKSNASQEMKQQQYNSLSSNWVQRNAPTNYMNYK